MYPDPFWKPIVGRERKRLGNAVGLTQFGVNLTTLKPGAWSSQRHWHSNEDEFVYVLEGEIVLCRGRRRDRAQAGRCRGLEGRRRQRPLPDQPHASATRSISRSARGRRTRRVVYSDIDMRLERDKARRALPAQVRRAVSGAEGVTPCRRSTSRKSRWPTLRLIRRSSRYVDRGPREAEARRCGGADAVRRQYRAHQGGRASRRCATGTRARTNSSTCSKASWCCTRTTARPC